MPILAYPRPDCRPNSDIMSRRLASASRLLLFDRYGRVKAISVYPLTPGILESPT